VKLVAVEARISEQTPRDLRGVRTLAQALAPPQATRIEGRSAPFGDTPWAEDLEASRGVLERAGAELSGAVGAGTPCVTLAPDCALGLATLPTVARAAPNARILWLDAHADFDTPQTSTTGFLGCMSLAGACGRWDSGLGTVAEDRVVLCGVRGKPGDFDHAGQLEAEAGALTMLPVAGASAVPAALGDAPVYVHLDPDVLDPAANPVPYARPGGLALDALVDLLGAVAARGPVLGLELTAFHTDDDAARRRALGAELARAIEAALG